MSLDSEGFLTDRPAVAPFARFAQASAHWIAPSRHLFVKPLLLGLLLALVNLVVTASLYLIMRATSVGAPRHPLAAAADDPALYFVLTTVVAPAVETLAMVLLYELLRVLLRRNTLSIGLSIVAAAVWAHGPSGLLAISIALPSRPGESHPEPLTDPDLT